MRLRIGVRFDETGRPVGAILSDNVPMPVEQPEGRHRLAGSIVVGRSGARMDRDPSKVAEWNARRATTRAGRAGVSA